MKALFVSALLASCSALGLAFSPLPPNPWSKVTSPTQGPAESIGEYAAGCLRGAVQLAERGDGFQTMRPQRNRRWGHPALLDFIEKLGQDVKALNAGDILIGDMGMPRGGPTLSGHASHQTGLDVDIWYFRAGRKLGEEERRTLNSPLMVVRDFESLTKNWRPETLSVLRLAASSPLVERMFVDPVIKREACRNFAGQSWVGKLRPWWAHDDHFHVRLHCQPGSSHCDVQDPVPPGDGCDKTLDEWFTAESRAKAKDLREHPSPPEMPKLPALCQEVLKAHSGSSQVAGF
jgi:penicillin-insensitive murein DD-endopeptidase